MKTANFCLLKSGRGLRPAVMAGVLFTAVLMCGCEGDQGPAGPTGPTSEENGYVVEFLGGYPVLQADGESSTRLEACVMTPGGNYVEGRTLKFKVVSGEAVVSPSASVTDARGMASCVFTAGRVPGEVLVSASIEISGTNVSDIAELFLDSTAVSGPLLCRDFPDPLVAHWSHDGGMVVFQTSDYSDFSLFKVDCDVGVPVYLGNYRGGSCNPDGSGRIAVFGPGTDSWEDNSEGFILDYDGRRIGGGFRPTAFRGRLRNMVWCQGGDSLLVASSTNGILGVTDSGGKSFRQLDLEIWVSSLSTIPNSPLVAAVGGAFEMGGIYRVDLDSGDYSQLVSSTGYSLAGASVDPQGISLVFSGAREVGDKAEGIHDLFMVPFSGGEPVAFFTSPVEELYPVWSPDGKKILFCSDRSGSGYNLYVYTVPQ